jgi:hypothetical protein
MTAMTIMTYCKIAGVGEEWKIDMTQSIVTENQYF